MPDTLLNQYFSTHAGCANAVVMTDGQGKSIPLKDAVDHMAIDCSKTGDLRAAAFNDGASFTCLGNEYGYDQALSRQIGYFGMCRHICVLFGCRHLLRRVQILRNTISVLSQRWLADMGIAGAAL